MAQLKAAIVVLAGTQAHEDLARVVNALEAVKELKEAGDDVQLIFDGAGVQWPGELTKADHKLHDLYGAVKDHVAGVCEYCADAFGVRKSVTAAGAPFSSDYEGHPSFRQLLADGYHVITF